jgi:hypothetical protein
MRRMQVHRYGEVICNLGHRKCVAFVHPDGNIDNIAARDIRCVTCYNAGTIRTYGAESPMWVD